MAHTPISINMSTGQAEITGNTSTSTKLKTGRVLTIGNTGKTFDGSANVSWNLNEIGVYSKSEVDTKVNSSNSFGSGYRWGGLRAINGAVYTNNYDRPIAVGAGFGNKGEEISIKVDGVVVSSFSKRVSHDTLNGRIWALVPVGSTYQFWGQCGSFCILM